MLPLAAVLSMAAISAIRTPAFRSVLVAMVLLTSGFNFISKADVIPALSPPVTVSLAVAPEWTLADGRGNIQRYISYSYPSPRVAARLPRWEAGWLPVSQRVAAFLLRYSAAHHRGPILFLGSRDPLFNTNSIGLNALR